jgi:hypothetical protein
MVSLTAIIMNLSQVGAFSAHSIIFFITKAIIIPRGKTNMKIKDSCYAIICFYISIINTVGA